MRSKKLLCVGTLVLSVIFGVCNVSAAKNTKGEKFYDFSKVNGAMSFDNNESKPKDRTIIDGDLPGEKKLKVTHISQQNNYYCGPASALMVLNTIGYNSYNQDSVAKLIGTNENGTGAGQDYIPRGLNSVVEKDGKFKFHWADHKYDDVDSIRMNIMSSISYGNPVIINSYEKPGDVYIHGHDIGIELYHFGVVSEYYSRGTVVTYLDPGYGLFNGFIKSQQVKIKDISYAAGGRGYIW